ncbi:ABC transporter substrate-binding protein [Bosea sp. PAMC 26642]|uniref:ABC transporter substrate-binding protein n=1 Tax=Bosea sp. (strain PAMC 26642) TaxID=1792307 RepID=UPI0009E6E1A4|nr:ABC transporter substrate-binding protein [Bosea sp. PAMC 26642]
MRRRTFLSATAGFGVALAAPRIARAQGSRVLRFVPQSDLSVLDPIWTGGYVTRNHGLAVFDTLYGLDDQLQPQPQMVAGHRIEDDGRTWILRLRDGLQFHDGTAVLARDCVASIVRWAKRDSFGQTLMAATDELRADDDRTLRFRLKKPFPLLPAALGKAGSNICAIMPERLAQTDAFVQVKEMIGSGPFRFLADERVAGARAVYARFDKYLPRESGVTSFTAGPKVSYFDRIEWNVLPDPSTAAAAMQTGEMDWWENPSFDLLPIIRRKPGLVVSMQDPSGYIGTMRFNHLQAPFNNPALRRAVLKAVRQNEFMQAVAGDEPGAWRDGVGMFCPGAPMASDTGLSVMQGPFDQAALRKEVAASGYKGERVVVLIPSDFPILKAMGEVGADLMSRIGLNIDAQITDWGSVLQRLAKTESVEQGGWSAYHTYWAGLDHLNPAVNSSLRGNGRSAGRGWPTSDELESLRHQWLEASSLSDQKRLAAAMQERALQDVPYIPLGQLLVPVVHRKELTHMLKGFSLFWNVRKE